MSNLIDLLFHKFTNRLFIISFSVFHALSVNAAEPEAEKAQAAGSYQDCLTTGSVKKLLGGAKFNVLEAQLCNPYYHIIARHIGRTEEELKLRIKNNPKMKIASTYADSTKANTVIGSILDTYQDKIQNWLAKKQTMSKLVLKHTFPEPVGYGIKRDEKRYEFTRAVVILTKIRGNAMVLTSYPTE